MLSREERALVEAIRKARTIDIVINDMYANRMVVHIDSEVHDVNNLKSDIRLAVQRYYNDKHRIEL